MSKLKNLTQTKMLLLLCFLFVLGYVFFFNSKTIIPDGEVVETSSFHTALAFNYDRTVTLNRWDYSKEQKTMEVEFEVTNDSFDGVDTYEYTCLIKTDRIHKYPVKMVVNRSDFIVVHIENVPDKFKSISLRLQPKGYKDDSIMRLVGSPDSVTNVSDISIRTLSEYQKLRIYRQIEKHQQNIDTLKSEYQAAESKIRNIQAKNQELDTSKLYQTAEDIEKTNSIISKNNALIDELKQQQINNVKQQQEYQLKIEKAQEKAKSIK